MSEEENQSSVLQTQQKRGRELPEGTTTDSIFSKMICGKWGRHDYIGTISLAEAAFLSTTISTLRAENANLRTAMTPMQWTREMSDAWHQALPDTSKAFADLLSAALAPQPEKSK